MAVTWAERLDAIERQCTVAGWDSYGARPVAAAALARARALCPELELGGWDPQPVPLNSGGILLELADGGDLGEIGCDGVLR